jgi:hypothetical protein
MSLEIFVSPQQMTSLESFQTAIAQVITSTEQWASSGKAATPSAGDTKNWMSSDDAVLPPTLLAVLIISAL